MSSFPVSLQFGAKIPEPVRSRMSYAFRVFAAVYGHAVIEEEGAGNAICCVYGGTQSLPGENAFAIPALYREDIFTKGRTELTKQRYAEEDIYLACGADAGCGRPDWLGEIFLWLSSSQEVTIAGRDDIGRIPYSATIFGSTGISPRKPHAALLMAWMENELRNRGGQGTEALPQAPSPVHDVEHLVVCSHDIDFYFTDRASLLARLLKNLVVAVTLYQDWSYFRDNLKMLLQSFAGKRVGEYLPALINAAVGGSSFRSTLFVVARQAHRRDPNYKLEQIAAHLRKAVDAGFTVGMHGSYRSVLEERTLKEETRTLTELLGQAPLSGRQHWLRFGKHATLFEEIERAGLGGDSTLGFSETVGFRNGASFAFPPYDFARERPHEFLEIPLVLMDGSLEATARALRKPAQKIADEVLNESRRLGWGGVSVLWHNPVEPISVPQGINDVFWNCAKQQKKAREQWMSAEEFLARSLPRYHAAGLLQGLSLDRKNEGDSAG